MRMSKRQGEKTLDSGPAFAGRLFSVDVQIVALGSGRTARREIVRHPGAVVVLARLPDGRFVFVRQYRKPVERFLLEAIAGCRQRGEPPARCARREVLEECGHRVARLYPLGAFYPAPGYSDERLYAYFAELDPASRAQAPDADEELDVVCMTAREFERLVVRGKIDDAKTLAIWHLYWRRRPDACKP